MAIVEERTLSLVVPQSQEKKGRQRAEGVGAGGTCVRRTKRAYWLAEKVEVEVSKVAPLLEEFVAKSKWSLG